jgi:(S)-ureidoglycine aminohydrolase
MQQLGYTRSAHHPDHLLQTPDTFVRTPLPGMRNATAIVHLSPVLGANFTQYTAEFDDGGVLGLCESQRFIYVLEGELEVCGRRLIANDYAYLPPGSRELVSSASTARAAVIEKPYRKMDSAPAPEFFAGSESMLTPTLLMGDPWLQVRTLVPDDPVFDFAVNTMLYHPGASLPLVEVHVMEHGLLMLEGGGIYRLGNHWYPVTAGDFIWMRAFCPQWFGALGKTPAKYLIYKDWNRHPLDENR